MMPDKRDKTIRLVLAFCLFGFISIVGGGFYEMLNIYPAMLDGPPRSLYMFQGEHGVKLHPFWIASHSFSELSLIVLLVLCWKRDKVLRSWLLKAFALHMSMRMATFLYFAPTIMRITAVPYADMIDPALDKDLTLWMSLSIVRVPLSVMVAWFVLKAYVLRLKEQDIF